MAVERGKDYGHVEPVMIDADIFGWASHAVDAPLRPDQAKGLRRAAEELRSSLALFPAEAQPYFARLVHIAEQALDA